ncbi:fumarylacetoacetate hydrolase family protein [Alicyclobacillus sp. ALC3]|uniref:fumarylacetoacetate hydrolase family protein n=1 Tax=Alicyclobacillus sp. ALC3 TaxID=2796143 RepID=UPI002379DA95|nr:fumarylacetoacetate hydrolase family protein [Alicyclobacillus sp. ALC3]WDL95675.1 fumarylacetoacetate hydrolase family protein [Alicyclobacillus sp. ALC3]
MRLALYNDNQLGVVVGEMVVEVGNAVRWDKHDTPRSFRHLLEGFVEYRAAIETAALQGPKVRLSDVQLLPPVPSPGKIVAAPVNYMSHKLEMNQDFTVERLGFFLKAPSSIIGPEGTVRLPFQDRRTDHEGELAFVIGKQAKDIPASQASEYIFGYFGLMDITVRGQEDRPMRKSYDSFTPIGPWIVTSDEVGDPHTLDLQLWVNDELRQSANTSELVANCYRFFEIASHVMTLYPGDIVTTGTPEGVGPIVPGDRVRLRIDRIGEFSVNVDLKR